MSEENLTCEDCGRKDESVKHTTCPYCEDVNGEIVEVDLCENCHYERAMDI